MFLARRLKKDNICEYLLYMWQLEDLIRALELNIDLINEKIIASYPATDEQHISLYDWYESLIEMMRLENVQTEGHLQLNINTLSELEELHDLLLHSGKDVSYNAKFYHVLSFITQMRKLQNNSQISDIELCFNFQYGVMLLRLKKSEITFKTLKAQNEISKFMALLAKDYRLYKSGDLDFNEQ
jgi:hypothetical protein